MSDMLTRNEKGRLIMNTLELQIFLGDLYAKCKTEAEIEFVRDNILGHADNLAEEREEELQGE